MKKKIFAEELTAGEPIQSVFLAQKVEVRKSRDGEPFLHLELMDRTGTTVGRAWNEVEMLASRVSKDDFVALRGEVKEFAGDRYVEIADLDRVDDGAIDPADFFAVSRWDGAQLLEQLESLVEEHVESAALRRFLAAALSDPDVSERLRTAPAAMRNHHAFLGGLVEHALSMTRLAVRISAHYADTYPGLLDGDLVVAGCILHDLAKVWELSWSRGIDYTDPGRLVGHIPMGIQFVRATAEAMEPPPAEDLVWRLEHMVASHHGELEYGSPVTPKTPEAMVLHQIDMIDSRLNMCWNEAQSAWDAGSRWSDYSRPLGTRIFVGDRPRATGEAILPIGPGLPADGDTEAAKLDSNLDLFEG